MATKSGAKRSSKIVVAAIDFGTTYSGYAFAFLDDLQKKPPVVHANTSWIAGSGLMSQKTPTALLLDPNKKFVAFGYDAESKYGELAGTRAHHRYYYFRRFKMKLYKEQYLTRKTTLTEEEGKQMNAIDVFSLCIKFLVEHCFKSLQNGKMELKMEDVCWVLTVPAIWNDGAKQFMREAAKQAGIKTDSLHIALEPEAASLCCKNLSLKVTDTAGGESKIDSFKQGTRYMVVDVGGGTVDIIAHQVVAHGKVKELTAAHGNHCGGTSVDAAFEEFLGKVFGTTVMADFKKNHMESWVDLQRMFEVKKRAGLPDTSITEMLTLSLPFALIETYKKVTKKDIDTVKENREFKGKVTCESGKFRFHYSIMKELFKSACDNTVNQVGTLLRQNEVKEGDTIMLVGGFSGSPILQDALRSAFPGRRLVIPVDAELAVVKGAVLFGHDPLTVVSRIAKISYGIRVYRDFEKSIHPASKREEVNGRVKCKDVFARHVQSGQTLVVDEPQLSQRYIPLEADLESLYFDIYSSKEKDPQFVTDPGTSYIGQLEVEIPGYGKDRGVLVSLIFGGTEVTVVAKEEATQKVTKATLDFLFENKKQ